MLRKHGRWLNCNSDLAFKTDRGYPSSLHVGPRPISSKPCLSTPSNLRVRPRQNPHLPAWQLRLFWPQRRLDPEVLWGRRDRLALTVYFRGSRSGSSAAVAAVRVPVGWVRGFQGGELRGAGARDSGPDPPGGWGGGGGGLGLGG